MKLILMTDFVLLISKQTTNEDNSLVRNFNKIKNYAKFLKQPLELEMFVPCDEKNEPLDGFIHNINLTTMSEEWNKAKEKVLFEGFTYNSEDELVERGEIDGSFWSIDIDEIVKYTIEDMVQCDLILTQNAIKQFM